MYLILGELSVYEEANVLHNEKPTLRIVPF